MPAMHFIVCWPDGSKDTCYSPSTVVERYFQINHPYLLHDFVEITTKALEEASERVNAKFGYYCSSAQDQLSSIMTRAQRFKPEQTVTIEKSQQFNPEPELIQHGKQTLSCHHHWWRAGRTRYELEPDAKRYSSPDPGTSSSGMGMA